MRTAREYLRVSEDASGRMRSPDEQHAEHIGVAGQRGVQLLEPYREAKAVGASRHSRGRRDDFAQLLDDLTAGSFGADELWLWEHSRGSRKTGEWVQLVDALEGASVHAWVTTHGRTYDPANARDRRSLLEDAIDSEYESAKISERVNRSVRARAAAGRPHGKNLYGYRREYEIDGRGVRTYLRTVPDPEQAPIVEEVFGRFANGESFAVIGRSLTRRGVPTPRGAPVWNNGTLLTMVRNEGYLGRRVSQAGHETVNGAWPELIDEATWWRCRARLADPHRAPRLDLSVKHLLSGIARCGMCGGPMQYKRGRDRGSLPRVPMYECAHHGHVGRSAKHVEEDVLGFVFGMWAEDERVSAAAGDDAEIGRLESQRAGLDVELRMWQDSSGTVGLSPASVAKAEQRLQPQIEELDRLLDVARAGRSLPHVDGPLDQEWDDLDLAMQRRIIAGSVTITVLPVGRGRHYSSDSVQITPRW